MRAVNKLKDAGRADSSIYLAQLPMLESRCNRRNATTSSKMYLVGGSAGKRTATAPCLQLHSPNYANLSYAFFNSTTTAVRSILHTSIPSQPHYRKVNHKQGGLQQPKERASTTSTPCKQPKHLAQHNPTVSHNSHAAWTHHYFHVPKLLLKLNRIYCHSRFH